MRTLADIDAWIPAGIEGYQGPWIGWYLRMLFTPVMGYDDARDMVVRVLGPAFDYEAPHYVGNCATVRRGPRKERR